MSPRVNLLSKANGKQEDLETLLRQKPNGYDRRLLRNVYVLSITMGIMTVFFGWQYYQSLYLYNGLGASPLEVGIFFSVASLAHALSGVPASLVSDRHGRKKFVFAGTLINGFVYMSYALCGTWFLLMVPLFIQNLVHAAYINPMNALLAESAPPEKRGIANGIFQAISGLISFFAPLIALSIILQFGQDLKNPATLRTGMPYLFLLCGGTVVIMAIARGLALRETHVRLPSPPKGLHLDNTSTGTGIERTSGSREGQGSCDAPRLRSRSVVGFYIFVSIAAVVSSVISYFIPIYGENVLNLDLTQLATLFSVSTGVSTLVQLPTGRLADSSRKKMMLLIAVILFASAIVLFLRAEDFVGFIVAQIPFSAAGALLYNTEFTMISCYARRRNRSTAFSIQTAINDIASIPWPLIGGVLFGISPQLPFEFSLIITIPAFIAGILLVHEPNRPTAE
jgi:MFS family permease